MKAAVIYESMYGNTHAIARSIAQGMEPAAVPEVLSVEEAGHKDLRNVDLLVVGGPTHIHGLSRKAMREAALQDVAEHPGKGLVLDPSAPGPGLREWFDALEKGSGKAAAFDTRAEGPELLTGRASKTIARKLSLHGFELLAEPASFLVSKDNRLLPGEQERAIGWGRQLAAALARPSH
jgi:hypothetical protein